MKVIMCLVGEQLIVEHFCALSSLSRTCNDIITSVKYVGFLWCIITHNPIDHIIWTNYSKCSPKQRLYLLHINPVWISGLWLHFNTEGTTWISGSEHNWSWEKKKAAGEQRETLEPLAFPSLRVVFTTETIQKAWERPSDLSTVVLSPRSESAKVSQSDSKSKESGHKREKEKRDRRRNSLRSVLARARRGRHLYARLNFGALAFSD